MIFTDHRRLLARVAGARVDRLAELGYAAFVADLFGAGSITGEPKTIRSVHLSD